MGVEILPVVGEAEITNYKRAAGKKCEIV